ncbi:MAG: hypothetical protein JWN38_933 [Candidatus Saccharibacteria bacterium]|nr:hypothetical protein [Candidatus Saccharibacteria bacterium]
MVSESKSDYPFVRASRDVIASREVKRFHGRVGQICLRIFEDGIGAFLRQPHSLDTVDFASGQPIETVNQGIDIEEVDLDVRPVSDYRLVLFERRARPGDAAVKNMRKLYLQADRTKRPEDETQLWVRLNAIAPSVRQPPNGQGCEYSLRLADDAVAEELVARQRSLLDNVRSTVPGNKLLQQVLQAGGLPPLEIPFVQLPGTATRDQIDDFEYSVNEAALPLRRVQLGRLHWESSS